MVSAGDTCYKAESDKLCLKWVSRIVTLCSLNVSHCLWMQLRIHFPVQLSSLCSEDFHLQSRYGSELKYAPLAARYPENSFPKQGPWTSEPLWIRFWRDLQSAVHIVKFIHLSSPCLCIATSSGWHFWQMHENCTGAASGRWRQRKSVLCL